MFATQYIKNFGRMSYLNNHHSWYSQYKRVFCNRIDFQYKTKYIHTILEPVVEVFNMLVLSKIGDMHTQVGLSYPKEENIRKSFLKHFGKGDWTSTPIYAQREHERSFRLSVTSSNNFLLYSPNTKLVMFVISRTIRKNHESRNKNNYCIWLRPFKKIEYERTFPKVLDLKVWKNLV